MNFLHIQIRTYNSTNKILKNKFNREYLKRRNRMANLVHKEELRENKKKKGIEETELTILESMPFDEVPVPDEILKKFNYSFKKTEPVGKTLVNKKADSSKLSADEIIKRAEKLKPLHECKSEMDIIDLIDSIYHIDVMSPKLARICFLRNSDNLSEDIYRLGQLAMEKIVNQINDNKRMDPIDIFRIYLLRKLLVLPKNIHDIQYFEMMNNFLISNDKIINLGQLPKSFLLSFVREVKVSYMKKEIELERASEYIDIFTEYCFKNKISLLNMETLLGIGYFLTFGKLKFLNNNKYYSMMKYFLEDKNLTYHKDEAREIVRILKLLGFEDYANSLVY